MNTNIMSHSDSTYFASFDGVRVLSVLWVFAFHCLFGLNTYFQGSTFDQYFSSIFVRFASAGHLGVDFFLPSVAF